MISYREHHSPHLGRPSTGETGSEAMEAAVIQPLPEAVAAQIAAGQVIDSLAAVVRELVENALDAQATRVTIDLWPESGRIQVADNGQGLSLDNLQRAAAPHSTSKIHTQADLWQVASLGFRGQALHSLAQAGQLTLCSRPPGAETGWQVTYSEAGAPQQSTPTAMASGTIATVTNLFQDWPARRLGLPSSARQLRAVQHILYDLALCHPQVTWLVRLGDRPWFSLTPGPTARALWPQMISTLGAADLREIHQAIPWVTSGSTSSSAHTHQAKAASLYGLIGLPDRCHRARPDQVKVAVNGRRVALPELEQAALRAFRHTLPRHRYPLCFLHLRVPPYALDWHRRADKSTLYLRQLDRWLAQVEDCIDTLLRQPTLGEADSANHQRVTTLLKAAEIRGSYQPPPQRQVNLSDPLPASPWPGMLTALAQVHNRYIVAEQPDGLCLVEQHIAHERVLYERLLDQWQVVPLAVPVVLDQLSEAQVDQLQRLGLGVELFGPRRWAIRRVPAPLCDRSDLSEALLELSLGRDLDNALVAIACRTAIRNGTPLTLPEMQTLLNDWQRTRNPRTCPHGRPIALTLTESSLARFFRRHWVIGKSHGLE